MIPKVVFLVSVNYGYTSRRTCLGYCPQGRRGCPKLYGSVVRQGKWIKTIINKPELPEWLLAAVMVLPILHENSEVADVVTISIGCASADMSAETLFDQADRALYQAKANGRNRIELSD